ncbi:MAG: GNAT family N-acetyltransferase [Oscillospiraceae bacterium]|nr:GNAT family N-acetyltransferase [Oscillospiraceae bacterium]
MTHIWLLRHAEAEGNLYRRIHGCTDSGLTELGRKQLKPLGERFQNVPLDAVYASDLRRSQETARALAEPKGLSLRILPGLREVNMGAWEDRCWGYVARFEPEQYRALNKDPAKFTVPGCEPYEVSVRRILGAIRQIAAENPGGEVAAVAHGCIIRILLAKLLGVPSENIWSVPHGDNTCVAELEAEEDGEIRLLHYNDNSHLPAELSAFAREDWWKREETTDGRDLYYLPMDVESVAGGKTYLRRYRETWIASHGTDLGFSDIYLTKARASAQADPMTVLEVYAGETPCGMLELSPQKGAGEGAGHITLLFLEREFRDQGLGVQLLGQAVSYYRKLGRKFLRLHVSDTNIKALKFYENWGFHRADAEPDSFGETYVMEKPI